MYYKLLCEERRYSYVALAHAERVCHRPFWCFFRGEIERTRSACGGVLVLMTLWTGNFIVSSKLGCTVNCLIVASSP